MLLSIVDSFKFGAQQKKIIFLGNSSKSAPLKINGYSERRMILLQHADKDLYSRKDMNLWRFNIDCMQVCCVARLPIVQFVDDARDLINHK